MTTHIRIETYENSSDRLFVDDKPIVLHGSSIDIEDLAPIFISLGAKVDAIFYEGDAAPKVWGTKNPDPGFVFLGEQ